MDNEKYSNNYLSDVIFPIKFSTSLLDLYTNNESVIDKFKTAVESEFQYVHYTTNITEKNKKEYLTWNFRDKFGDVLEINGKELNFRYNGKNYTNFNDFLKKIRFLIKSLGQYSPTEIIYIGLR